MGNNIFFGGDDIVLTVKKEATKRQIEILKKMHPGAVILIEKSNFKKKDEIKIEGFSFFDSFYNVSEECDFCEAGNNDKLLDLVA